MPPDWCWRLHLTQTYDRIKVRGFNVEHCCNGFTSGTAACRLVEELRVCLPLNFRFFWRTL
jgi:hypothetical protein